LINPINLKKQKNMGRIIKDIKLPNQKFMEVSCTKLGKRYFIDMPYNDFLDLIEGFGTRFIHGRGKVHDFKFLAHHKQLLKMLYCYMKGDEQFFELVPKQTLQLIDGTGHKKKITIEPDFMKGIMLYGSIGCGKTIIMEAFLEVFNYIIMEDPFNRLDAEEWDSQIASKSITYFKYKPLFINDFFKECDESKSWGKPITPAKSTIGLRGETGAWTMATSNNKLESFHQRYGEYISSRMIEMFNFIENIGPNLRNRKF
jgi:hypothetical protein